MREEDKEKLKEKKTKKIEEFVKWIKINWSGKYSNMVPMRINK